jgi:hypothetical protein
MVICIVPVCRSSECLHKASNDPKTYGGRVQGIRQEVFHLPSFLNTVDVHNKLAVGPRIVSGVYICSLSLKMWFDFLAMAETNAYLLYARRHKLTSDEHCHALLEQELLRRAQEDAVAVEEEAGVNTRRSEERGSGVASVSSKPCAAGCLTGSSGMHRCGIQRSTATAHA